MFCAKTNVAAKPAPVEFLIDPDTHEFVWVGETDMVIADVLGEPERRSRAHKKESAAEWLEVCLSEGPRRHDVVKAASGEAGFSWATMRRAKDEIGAKSKPVHKPGQRGADHHLWFLPQHEGDV